MLRRLNIENYALLEGVEVFFGKGLNVLTGETGAGKTILVGALGMALGQKADAGAVRRGASRAVVEMDFDVSGLHLEEFNPEDGDGILAVRREVNGSGRTKASVNGRSASVSLLKSVGGKLVDMHGQHEHQSLLDPERHVDFLDAYAGVLPMRESVRSRYLEVKRLKEELRTLVERRRTAGERRELLDFQLHELKDADPSKGEIEELENEINRLEHAETLIRTSKELVERLYEGDDSLYEELGSVRGTLENLASLDKVLSSWVKEASSAAISIREIAEFLSSYATGVDLDPERLQSARDRFTLLMSLVRKYGGSEEAMLAKMVDLQQELESSENLDARIEGLEKEVEEKTTDLASICLNLSAKRAKAAGRMEREIVDSMVGLGIEKAAFEVSLSRQTAENGWVKDGEDSWFAHEKGIDSVEFMITTNVGEELKPLVRVASGGEVSRIMLAIKAILADRDSIPLLIFDEIDIGISGRIAEAVGRRLKELSKYHQIICITHLPQIAGKADHHFEVRKTVKENRTFSEVTELGKADRKEAVARLLAGRSVTESARKQAEEMIK